MKREIKFRALLENKIWRWWEYYTTFDQSAWSGPFFGAKIIVKDLQYIGLKDKNGKEIYEDDIVECLVDFNLGQSKMIGIISFRDSAFSIKGKVEKCSDGYERNFLVCDCFNLKILGNKHENPEIKCT